MNPYLEQPGVWPSFHTQVLTAFVAQLVPQLVPNYLVQLEERISLHEPLDGPDRAVGRADLGLVRTAEDVGGPSDPLVARAAVLEPAVIELPLPDYDRQRYIEIRDRRGRALVTVIELLSPSNKRPGPDRLQYLAKRAAVLCSPAHLVEIDLLRGGPRLPAVGRRPDEAFSVIISRSGDRPQADYWSIGLRNPLPVVPIPLHPEDPPARLDLKGALDKVYDEGGFAYLLYDDEPEPPLHADDAAWARQVLAGVA
jgi:hypothetical protein